MFTEKQIPGGLPDSVMLHICCAPDAVVAVKEIMADADRCVAGFFYDPNIHPEKEYRFRLEEMKHLADKMDFHLYEGEYDDGRWFEQTRGLEEDPEGGRRCEVCIDMRLRRTALEARERGFKNFATVLTNSPKKNVAFINDRGAEIGRIEGICYIKTCLRKSEGFKNSVRLGKEYGLYRQNYCGCRYSFRDVKTDGNE